RLRPGSSPGLPSSQPSLGCCRPRREADLPWPRHPALAGAPPCACPRGSLRRRAALLLPPVWSSSMRALTATERDGLEARWRGFLPSARVRPTRQEQRKLLQRQPASRRAFPHLVATQATVPARTLNAELV